MSKLETNTIDNISGSSTLTVGDSNTSTISIPKNITLGASGTTITVPSGATITNNGTQTGFGGVNTPAFEARLSNEPSVADNTWTKAPVNVEIYDVGGCYDNSTNYRFTPTTAGKYVFYFQVSFNALNDQVPIFAAVYKNGSTIWGDAVAQHNSSNSGTSACGVRYTITAEANGSSDYFEAYAKHGNGSNRNFTAGNTFFGGYKLVE